MAEPWSVVMNDEEQYSVWESDRDLPAGWHRTGHTGTREACLAHIDEVWTDLRPKSLRTAMTVVHKPGAVTES
jgi:MbtH protein